MNEVVRIMWRADFSPHARAILEQTGYYHKIIAFNDSICVLDCFPDFYWPWDYVRHCVKMK